MRPGYAARAILVTLAAELEERKEIIGGTGQEAGRREGLNRLEVAHESGLARAKRSQCSKTHP